MALARVALLLLLLGVHGVSDEDSERCADQIETKMGQLADQQSGGDLKAFFKGYDRNGDGEMQEEEIREAMKAAGISEDCHFASDLIMHMDKNGDQMLHYSEL
eukprot:Skav214423  [mRNA]  locus=scaffold586:279647:279955:+ [translate_table: standard]